MPEPMEFADAAAAAVERDAVEHAIAAGFTWVAIAASLGVSRQAVSKKHATGSGERRSTRRSRDVALRREMAECDAVVEAFAQAHAERVAKRRAG